jgi:hypothetical protein
MGEGQGPHLNTGGDGGDGVVDGVGKGSRGGGEGEVAEAAVTGRRNKISASACNSFPNAQCRSISR